VTDSYAGEAWLALDEAVPVQARLEEYPVPAYALQDHWGGTIEGDVPWIEHLARTVELRLPNGAAALVVITGASYTDKTLATVVGADVRPF
jgi:hypothetical protein